MPEQRPTWLIVGSAPSVVDWIDRARREADIVMTANSGILLCRRPDFYWLHDLAACTPPTIRYFRRKAQAAGTKIVTLDRNTKVTREGGKVIYDDLGDAYDFWLKDRDLAAADITVPGEPWREPIVWKRGDHLKGLTSGCHMLQFAINRGAGSVILIGCDGYASTPAARVSDTFDGRLGSPGGLNINERMQGPLFRAVMAACPDVKFTVYGSLRYELPGAQIIGNLGPVSEEAA